MACLATSSTAQMVIKMVVKSRSMDHKPQVSARSSVERAADF
jgi:hypothetical protein